MKPREKLSANEQPTEPGVRERISEAARLEFATRGLAAASVHAIAESAGVTAAMINYYFGGKDALYEGILADAQEALRAALVAAAEGPSAGLAARLTGAYFDFLARDRTLQRLLLREVLDRSDSLRERAARRGALRSATEALRAMFVQRFGDEPERRQRAISLFGAVAGYFVYEPLLGVFVDGDPLSRRALAARREHLLQLATTLEEMPLCSSQSHARST